jgi:hypothetical protein
MGGCHITPNHPLYGHFRSLDKNNFRRGDVVVLHSPAHYGELGIVLGAYSPLGLTHTYRVQIGYRVSDADEVLLNDPDVFVFSAKYLEYIDHDESLLKTPKKESDRGDVDFRRGDVCVVGNVIRTDDESFIGQLVVISDETSLSDKRVRVLHDVDEFSKMFWMFDPSELEYVDHDESLLKTPSKEKEPDPVRGDVVVLHIKEGVWKKTKIITTPRVGYPDYTRVAQQMVTDGDIGIVDGTLPYTVDGQKVWNVRTLEGQQIEEVIGFWRDEIEIIDHDEDLLKEPQKIQKGDIVVINCPYPKMLFGDIGVVKDVPQEGGVYYQVYVGGVILVGALDFQTVTYRAEELEVIDHDDELLQELFDLKYGTGVKDTDVVQLDPKPKRWFSPEHMYETLQFDDGHMTCNCMGWFNSNSTPKQCRHTREVKEREASKVQQEFIRPPMSDPVLSTIQVTADGIIQTREPQIIEDGKTYTFKKFRRTERERVDLTGVPVGQEPYDWYLVTSCGCCKDKKRIALKDIPFKSFEEFKYFAS